MKRPIVVFLAGLVPLVSIGCDRRTTADLILMIGAAGLTQPAEPPIDCKAAGPLAGDVRAVQRIQGVLLACGKLGADLRQLRELPSRRPVTPAEAARMSSILQQVGEEIEALAADLEAEQGLVSQVREVQLAALALAAGRDPACYLNQRDDFCHSALGRAYDESTLARISTQRFVGNYLASPDTAADAAIALTLHALAYPDCDANVALYVTVLDRLVLQGDASVADLVGQNGWQLLQTRPEAGMLRSRLASVTGPNGSLIDSANPAMIRHGTVAGGNSGPRAAWGARP